MTHENQVLKLKTKQPKLSVNITSDVLAQVDALVEMHRPFAKRHAVHLAALRVGLAELTARPERLLETLGHQG